MKIMNKPEYLTRECKTFLELLNNDEIAEIIMDIVNVIQFYSQPFTKDMIVRPEEPWRKQYIINGESPEDADKYHNEDMKEWNNWQPLFKGEWEVIPSNPGGIILYNGKTFEPGTSILANLKILDDFIREALKAGIKLEWLT